MGLLKLTALHIALPCVLYLWKTRRPTCTTWKVSFSISEVGARIGSIIYILYFCLWRIKVLIIFCSILTVHSFIHVYSHKLNPKCKQNHDKHAGQKGYTRL